MRQGAPSERRGAVRCEPPLDAAWLGLGLGLGPGLASHRSMLPATPRVAACSTCGDSRGSVTCSTSQQPAVHVVEAVTASTVIYSFSLYCHGCRRAVLHIGWQPAVHAVAASTYCWRAVLPPRSCGHLLTAHYPLLTALVAVAIRTDDRVGHHLW